MKLSKFDLFTKIDNEYRVGTTIGGIISLFSILTVILLSTVEIRSFYNPPIRQRLTVDTTRPTGIDGVTITMESQPRINIFVNITFPHIPCYLLSFDFIDHVTQLPIPLDEVDMHKYRLARTNKEDSFIVKGELDPDFMKSEVSKTPGSCYIDDHSKCYSCQEVFEVYNKKMFRPPSLYRIQQCSSVVKKLQPMREEGCRIESQFRAVRVAGQFLIAPGISWYNEGMFIHNLDTFSIAYGELNLSHHITSLHFTNSFANDIYSKNGKKIDHKSIKMPLDGFTNVQEESNRIWRVVYTSDILGDNYSVSRFSVYDPVNREPGIFFKYDISPILATTYLDREPPLHLVTRLLTVLGGALGLFRVFDAAIYMSKKRKDPEQIAEK